MCQSCVFTQSGQIFRSPYQGGVKPEGGGSNPWDSTDCGCVPAVRCTTNYSTFFDNARRRSTGLYGFLHRRRVNAIYVLGLATDYCVKYSTLDAIQLGFTTRVVTDACRGIDLEDGDMERAFQEMRRAGAGFVRSTDLLEHGLAANVGTDSKAVKNFP